MQADLRGFTCQVLHMSVTQWLPKQTCLQEGGHVLDAPFL